MINLLCCDNHQGEIKLIILWLVMQESQSAGKHFLKNAEFLC